MKCPVGHVPREERRVECGGQGKINDPAWPHHDVVGDASRRLHFENNQLWARIDPWVEFGHVGLYLPGADADRSTARSKERTCRKSQTGNRECSRVHVANENAQRCAAKGSKLKRRRDRRIRCSKSSARISSGILILVQPATCPQWSKRRHRRMSVLTSAAVIWAN